MVWQKSGMVYENSFQIYQVFSNTPGVLVVLMCHVPAASPAIPPVKPRGCTTVLRIGGRPSATVKDRCLRAVVPAETPPRAGGFLGCPPPCFFFAGSGAGALRLARGLAASSALTSQCLAPALSATPLVRIIILVTLTTRSLHNVLCLPYISIE